MEIEVRLFSYLRDGRGKVAMLNLKEGANVDDVVKSLGIGDDVVANALINDVDADFSSTLKDGDVVSLFPLLAGG